MTEEAILAATQGGYSSLIHPDVRAGSFQREIQPLLDLEPNVPDPMVAHLLIGPSWRERLVGLAIAMVKTPSPFVEPMQRSLVDVRGIAIVPTCAVLAVLGKRNLFDQGANWEANLNRAAFDGEVGWAIDKARGIPAGLTAADDRGPNYGQDFAKHVEAYDWIHQRHHPTLPPPGTA
jgi:hypothetical protein